MGISKSDLLNHYYIDEIGEIFYEYYMNAEDKAEAVEYVDFGTFFNF